MNGRHFFSAIALAITLFCAPAWPEDFAPGEERSTQTLVFQDGLRLHGELVSLDHDEVIWRRADFSEALHFPRSEVRRIVLQEVGSEGGNADRPANVRATAKFGGGDWLFGDLRSSDGQVCTLTGPGNALFRFPRSHWNGPYSTGGRGP